MFALLIPKFVLAVLIVGAGCVAAVALYNGLAYRNWRTWPDTEGAIESADVQKFSLRGVTNFPATLTYSYSVNGDYYSGSFVRVFGEEEEAEAREYASAVRGTRVPVKYHPNKPSRSRLDIEPTRDIYSVPVPKQ